ncbi:hypothetical protein [Bradyrhizobium iriomotense]|uniref:Uncharacterized protein n=1 Tax=Bradyrhizobium iriomotense TaxID=441950 RepID=A0ABQ6BAF5_9BRAD|nr:hypothetical protein [Bradyrhizobium iriomotense]GLR89616.1 hypothetical protein GCM10007857_63300 [Bradyrhizobium iriomotense]
MDWSISSSHSPKFCRSILLRTIFGIDAERNLLSHSQWGDDFFAGLRANRMRAPQPSWIAADPPDQGIAA